MAKPRKRFDSLSLTFRRELSQLPEDDVQRLVEGSEQWMKELVNDPKTAKLVTELPEIVKGREIAIRLIKGVRDLRSGEKAVDSLNPVHVGLFLAELSNSKPDDLQWKVGRWLKVFNIARPGSGRPEGTRAEREQFLYFKKLCLEIIPEVWAKKKQFQRKYRYLSGWKNRLRTALSKDKLSSKEIDYVISSKSPLTLALHLTASRLGIKYETVQRNVRRYARW